MQEGTKKVFVSYSWSDQARVISIVNKLRANHIDTIFDLQDFEPGEDKYTFMEKSVNDPSVDYVLVFSSKEYTRKADERKGGVGDETQILGAEAYDLNQRKVQTILLERNVDGSECLPKYLRNKKYFDFSTPEKEQFAFEELIRYIYSKPRFVKPALGPKPIFLDEEKIDLYPLREELSRLPIGGTRRFYRFIDETSKKVLETISNEDIDENNYLTYYCQLQKIRMLCVDYAVRYYENDGSIVDFAIRLIENITNCISPSMSDIKQDQIRSLVHELLICMVAIIIYYDDYSSLKSILSARFSINNMYHGGVEFVTYTEIYHYSRYFEYINEKEERNKVCLNAEQIIRCTQYPHITQETLSTADLIMHHLRPILSGKKEYWFPILYNYFDVGGIKMWAKLESKSFLEYFKQTFSIDEERLIDIIKNNPYGRTMKHLRSWEGAPWISDFIDIEKIGKDA